MYTDVCSDSLQVLNSGNKMWVEEEKGCLKNSPKEFKVVLILSSFWSQKILFGTPVFSIFLWFQMFFGPMQTFDSNSVP